MAASWMSLKESCKVVDVAVNYDPATIGRVVHLYFIERNDFAVSCLRSLLG